MEFPDVIHRAGFAALKRWRGDVKDLPNLVLKKYKRQDLLKKAEEEEEEEEEDDDDEEAERPEDKIEEIDDSMVGDS